MMGNTQRQLMFESFFMDEIAAGRELTLFIQNADISIQRAIPSERIRLRRKMIALVHERRERIYMKMKSPEFLHHFPEMETALRSVKSDFRIICEIMENLGFDRAYIRSFMVLSFLEID